MKNFASANKYLSAAFAFAAIVAAGTVPASAQSRDHTGSMMPFYYDETGAQKTGAWSREEDAGVANKQRHFPARNPRSPKPVDILWLYVGEADNIERIRRRLLRPLLGLTVTLRPLTFVSTRCSSDVNRRRPVRGWVRPISCVFERSDLSE